MHKAIIPWAIAATLTAPAAALGDAVLYGRIHATVDYVDVDQNAVLYGPGANGFTSVPVNGNLLVPDTIFVTVDDQGVPVAARVLPAGDFDVREEGFLFVDGRRIDVEVGARVPVRPTEDFTGWNMASRSSRLGVRGAEDLGGGLKAIYQLEVNVPMLNNNNDIDDNDRGRIRMRNSFVGLSGGFGRLLVGRHDTPHKLSTGRLDLFNNTIVDYENALGFQDLRVDNIILYRSPNFNGFEFMGAVIPSGGDTPIGSGVPGDNPDGIADAFSLAAIYRNGPFYVGAGFERFGEDHWKGLEEDVVDSNGVVQRAYNGILDYGRAEDSDKWRLGLGVLDWNGFTVVALYESHSNTYGAPEDADMDIWQIQAGYSFGNNMIKAAYGQNDLEGCVGTLYSNTCAAAVRAELGVSGAADIDFLNNRDFDNWVVGIDHNFSRRTRVYALYTQTSSDQQDSDWSALSLGMEHRF